MRARERQVGGVGRTILGRKRSRAPSEPEWTLQGQNGHPGNRDFLSRFSHLLAEVPGKELLVDEHRSLEEPRSRILTFLLGYFSWEPNSPRTFLPGVLFS